MYRFLIVIEKAEGDYSATHRSTWVCGDRNYS